MNIKKDRRLCDPPRNQEPINDYLVVGFQQT